ncbi:ATP-dependent DNA ligase [Plantactinospora sp. KLBMP9567]|uniref:ATP-dependent DNA ligase n=1 Tax=Plantactinospora sp. KLBMP9567 TaxID=3085900 RepID=UPI002980EC3D|nr:ATP-dependent DNA ligase [Plantactinospora sp. KLBMP9567]MDW5323599.1 ATP-dependent DNA ligase [Plantactinospora sp. KLBMP9567]
MRFVDLAATSTAVAATSGRRAKVELLAEALRKLAPEELVAGSGYLAGELRQRQTGVGYASLRELPPAAEQPTLTVAGVDAAIAELAEARGPGSQQRRRELLAALFGAATVEERRLLLGLFSGELRQGAQAGLLAEAVARAAEVPLPTVRRALLLAGDLKTVAAAALTGGSGALTGFALQVGRPLAPMLAQSAASVEEALTTVGLPSVVDVKLDGIRIQVHRSGDDIAVFTRSLDEITSRVPEVVAAVRSLPARELVLDGEAIALDASGRPRPFQETASRAATRGARRAVRDEVARAPADTEAAEVDRTRREATELVDRAPGPSGAVDGASGVAGAVDSASGGLRAATGAGGAVADGGGTRSFGAAPVAPSTAGSVRSVGPVDISEVPRIGTSGTAPAEIPGPERPATVAPSVVAAANTSGGVVLTPYFFDILHLDGVDLLDAPGHERWAALARTVSSAQLVERITVDTVEQASAAFAAAVDAGHEGIVVKAPEAAYDAGRRGAAWVKVKPRHTLDLVVLAVEWGSGRRKGWLSNLHLGARDPETGGFVMLGKTFKGLTDELLRWQTERFQELAVERGDWVVRVRPEQVVEIAFDGVQSSPRYPGGVALRFARVLRYRDDKTAAEADTIDTVRAIHAGRRPD